jgi:hypothetical protein
LRKEVTNLQGNQSLLPKATLVEITTAVADPLDFPHLISTRQSTFCCTQIGAVFKRLKKSSYHHYLDFSRVVTLC